MDSKHTSELLAQAQYNLQNRRKYLFEELDRFDTDTEQDKILTEIVNDEINRIDKILKSLKKA
jgi:hypothetical protein